ncbi:MAG: hypothetical protein GX640_01280 [Fibrobacter sp.]|nr:hypothetical protein [Fibrobacter sp.]
MKAAFLYVLFVMAACLYVTPLSASEEVFFKAILPVEPPKITEEKVIFNIDLLIKNLPKEYWVHYNNSVNMLVVEFFNIDMKHKDLYIRGTDLIKNPEVLNLESNTALTKKSAEIRFSLPKKWHTEATAISDSILRLQIWKYIEVSPQIKKKKPNIILIAALICSGLCLASIGTTLIFRSYSD